MKEKEMLLYPTRGTLRKKARDTPHNRSSSDLSSPGNKAALLK